jgi:hypothetical protein
MPVKLLGGLRVELRWWWEAASEGEPLRLRDAHAARHFVASLCARSEHVAALQRFARQGAPGLWSPPDREALVDLLALSIAAGRVKVAQLARDPLTSWGAVGAEEPVAAPAVVAAPLPPPEEICWPCLRAAASARALREASADGAPFVVQG